MKREGGKHDTYFFFAAVEAVLSRSKRMNMMLHFSVGSGLVSDLYVVWCGVLFVGFGPCVRPQCEHDLCDETVESFAGSVCGCLGGEGDVVESCVLIGHEI